MYLGEWMYCSPWKNAASPAACLALPAQSAYLTYRLSFSAVLLPRSLKLSTSVERMLEPIPSLGPRELLPHVTPSRTLGLAVVVHELLRALPFTSCFPWLVAPFLLLFCMICP